MSKKKENTPFVNAFNEEKLSYRAQKGDQTFS